MEPNTPDRASWVVRAGVVALKLVIASATRLAMFVSGLGRTSLGYDDV